MDNCPQERLVELAKGDFIEETVARICATYEDNTGLNHIEGFNLPRQNEMLSITNDLLEVIFPGFSGKRNYSIKTIKFAVGEILSKVYIELLDQVFRSLRYNCRVDKCGSCDVESLAEKAVTALLESIPGVREVMKLDVAAALDGDPAARSMEEIIVSYPGVRAITIQRLAHVLYHENVPLIPRMMTEHAHGATGIDIHPGAHLGKGVFIDHGTGVVIGETASIGNNVKIYQGVTLGALSFPKDACGRIIKGARRHPTIEDNVTIYSGATILGNITIGKGSVIGGNVWLTESLPPGSRITISPPEQKIRKSPSGTDSK